MSNLPELFLQILEAQRTFPSSPIRMNETLAVERNSLLRASSDELRTLVLASGVTPTLGDWDVNFSGGQGMSAAIPWVRVFDATSPSAQDNWYLVFLFAEDGNALFISLCHGTTNLPKARRLPLMEAARNLLGRINEPGLQAGDLGSSAKASGYAETTVYAEEISSLLGTQNAVDAFKTVLTKFMQDLTVVISADIDQASETALKSAAGKGIQDSQFGAEISISLRAFRNVIVEGVAGTGKSHLLESLNSDFDEIVLSVFHPSTAYEEFVEGLRPAGEGFEVRDGIFLDICKRAASSPDRSFLLVIDEINRANLPRVLGDLLYAIEPSKRVPAELAEMVLDPSNSEETEFSQAFPLLQQVRGDGRRQRVAVPENLYILGTMNTTDRSVGNVDLALRRRFVFKRIEPLESAVLRELLTDNSLRGEVPKWSALNIRLLALSADALLGHSYFFEADSAILRAGSKNVNVWRDFLLPQLSEILVAFNALNRLEELLGGLEPFGGFTLRLVGSGIDAYPIVVLADPREIDLWGTSA